MTDQKDTTPRAQWQKPEVKRLVAGAAEDGGATVPDAATNPS